MNRFENRNVLITGAASGIGRAAAYRIASEGGHIALLDRDAHRLEEVVTELKNQFKTKVLYTVCDVSQGSEVKKAIDSLAEQLGGIQALSHNVGLLRSYHTHEMTETQRDELISVNLLGTLNVNSYALPHLLKNKVSYIVNISSSAFDKPHAWLSVYSACKGAIVSFTRSLAIEYALQGLRANSILPGGIDTPLAKSFTVPPGGDPVLLSGLMRFRKPVWINPEKVASVIAFLASDDAFSITGTEIAVDGGLPDR